MSLIFSPYVLNNDCLFEIVMAYLLRSSQSLGLDCVTQTSGALVSDLISLLLIISVSVDKALKTRILYISKPIVHIIPSFTFCS